MDRRRTGARVPVVDRRMELDTGIAADPCRVGNLFHQIARSEFFHRHSAFYGFGPKFFIFQNGDADALYKSVRKKLFSLPDDVLVYPAHDYKDRHVSSIAQEKKRNPRLGGERTLEEFKNIMANLNLPYPKFMDYAVPGNKQCGVCPCDLPEDLEKYCQRMTESPQG